MIISGRSHKRADKQLYHLFRVLGSTPTTAIIKYNILNTTGGIIETITTTIPLTSIGDDCYTFTTLIPAEEYTVKLNTESNILSYGNEFIDNNSYIDKNLKWSWTGSTPQIWLPACDVSRLNIELSTPDGVALDAQLNRNRKYWEDPNAYQKPIFIINGKQRLYFIIRIIPTYLREPGSTWQSMSTVNNLYVKVTNLSAIIANPLHAALLQEPKALEGSYGALMTRGTTS